MILDFIKPATSGGTANETPVYVSQVSDSFAGRPQIVGNTFALSNSSSDPRPFERKCNVNSGDGNDGVISAHWGNATR
jgi:hypothetical protein